MLTSAQIDAVLNAFRSATTDKEVDKELFVTILNKVRCSNPELTSFLKHDDDDDDAGLLFTLCDTNHSGKVDPIEVIAALSAFSSGGISEKAKLVFHAIDHNHDGSLTRVEIKRHASLILALSSKLVPQLNTIVVFERQFVEDITREVFSAADEDVNGKITLEEWLNAVVVKANNTARALISPNLSTHVWKLIYGLDGHDAVFQQVQRSSKGFAAVFDLVQD